jgi:hypothetical protein
MYQNQNIKHKRAQIFIFHVAGILLNADHSVNTVIHFAYIHLQLQHKSDIFGSYKKSRKATMHQFFHADSATSLPTRSCKVQSLCIYLQQWYEVQFNQSPKRGTFMREREEKNQQINQLISA